MTADRPKPDDDFLPPTDVGAEATNVLSNLLAFGLEATTQLPGVGSLLNAGVGLLRLSRANMQDAGRSFARVYAAHREEFKRLEGRVKTGELDRDTLHARLTMIQRAIHEAGRHPDKVLRDALGSFAARVLITDMAAI